MKINKYVAFILKKFIFIHFWKIFQVLLILVANTLLMFTRYGRLDRGSIRQHSPLSSGEFQRTLPWHSPTHTGIRIRQNQTMICKQNPALACPFFITRMPTGTTLRVEDGNQGLSHVGISVCIVRNRNVLNTVLSWAAWKSKWCK